MRGLSTSGMIFFITPTSQFLLGYFYFNEPFSVESSLVLFLYGLLYLFIFERFI